MLSIKYSIAVGMALASILIQNSAAPSPRSENNAANSKLSAALFTPIKPPFENRLIERADGWSACYGPVDNECPGPFPQCQRRYIGTVMEHLCVSIAIAAAMIVQAIVDTCDYFTYVYRNSIA
jgi:hypothetical protein